MSWTDMTQLTNCYGWFKPESLASSYANGDPISSWADSSGNGRDLSQATSANQPLALANAVNGHMAADFDGINDFLSSNSYTQSGDVVVSMVFSMDALKNYNGVFQVNSSSSGAWNTGNAWATQVFYTSGYYFFFSMTPTYNYLGNNSFTEKFLSANNYYIVTHSLCSKGRHVKIDGTNIAVNSASGDTASPPSATAYMFMGRTIDELDGKISEVVVYDAVDTDFSEVCWVEGYLADKYAITLPDGHLFKNEPPANPPTMYNPSSSGGGSSSPTYTSTAGTQIYPFRTLAEDDFDKGGTKFHPLS